MKNTEAKHSLTPTTLDRASFIVGLSAALLAFYPFKDSLNGVSVTTLFEWNISLYTAGLLFLGLLLLSAYLYGLNNIRYSVPRVLEWEFTRHLEFIALVVYIIAFLFPILLIMLWAVSLILGHLPQSFKNTPLIINFVSTIGGILTGFVGTLFSKAVYKNRRDAIIEDLQNSETTSEIETETARKAKDFKLELLSKYESLILALKSHLIIKIGIDTQKLPNLQVIRIAKDKGILLPQEFSIVDDLRGMRNRIAHSVDLENVSEASTIQLINRINPILARLRSAWVDAVTRK